MSAANSNSESGRVRLPVPVPLLPPLTINDNSYSEKKRDNSKKKLLVDIGRSSIDDKGWLILVRDHPRERLARSRVSAEEQEETLLARVAEKQDVRYPHDCPTLSPTSTSTSTSTSPSSSSGTNSACATPCTITTSTTSSAFNHRSSQEEEFYADIYQYYYDVTKPPSPSPSPPAPDITPSPPGRDYLPTSTPRPEHRPRPPVPPPIENPPLAMSKKRGSLQAIFVPSFLQSAISTTTTPPLTPAEASPPSTPGVGGDGGVVPGQGHGTAKYASRIRALSAAGSHSNSRANAGINANATGTSEPHQRKRSMTFSMSMSLSMASSLHSASASSSFPSNITSVDPSVAPSPSTHAPHTTPSTLSPRSSPPPAFLIDDDPFANLTSAPSESMGLGVGRFHHHAPPQPVAPVVVALPPPPPPIPRSPLHETPLILPSVASAVGMASSSSSLSSSVSSTASDAATVIASGSSSSTTSPIHTTPSLPIASIASITPSSPSSLSLTSLSKSPSLASLPKSPSLSSSSLSTLSSPKSTPLSVSKTPSLSVPSSPPAPPPQRTRPAHQRPAFSPRPSLPSLDTLARMNIVLTKKVRKGRVGAGLPFEPWDLPSDDECTPPPPPPPNASTSTSSSNSNSNVPAPSSVPAVRPQVASTSASGPSANTNTNMNTEAAAGQFSTPNPNSISTNISAPQSVSSSIASSIPVLSSSSPPLLPPFSTMVSPTHSPALSRSASPTLVSAPAQPLSRSTSPSASYLQYSASPSTQPSSPTSPTTSTSTRSRSSSSSFTPPATAPTFAAAPTSGYSPHPPPPPPMQMPIARPQPLLPSQILALGSIAADVEMVMPVSGFAYQLQGETGRMGAGAAEGFDYAWTKPAPAPAPGSRLSTYSPGTTIAMMLPVEEETEPGSLDVDFDAEAEAEEPEGYFGNFLDRYQRPSRAGSEDGHGVVHGRGQGGEPSVRDEKEEERVLRPADELVGQRGQAGVNPANVERDSFAEEYSYIYASGKLDNDGIKAEGNGDDEKPAGPSSHSGLDMTTRPGSAVFSSPPSSASLSRSFSMRSDSSMGSVDSACALEEVGAEGEVERVLGEEMWSYRRFAAPSRSLSSLELDLEGEGLAEEAQDTSKYDTLSAEERRRGDSTRSSSSHPSLSRTRSSSDDSDLLHSPTPDDHDYSFFPYSHARMLARIYQSSGYSALFTLPLASEEDGPSFHAGSPGHDLSLSSSIEEVGVAEAGWGRAFMAEPERGIRMPGGFTADTDGDGGFGFGFDKVIVAAEAQDDVVDVKEKESLTIATSIDVVQPTTVAAEADLPSPSSSDQHDLSLSASSNLSLVEPGISPLVSELDSVAHPTSLISDDELMSRSNMMASGAPTRFRTTTMRPRTSGQANDSTGYRSRGHSSTSSTSQPYRAGSSHGQPSNSIASNSHYHSMESRNNHAGWRRGESEDEDEEENRRRRRALERMYASDNMTKVASHSSSDDDGTDNCGVPSSSSSKNRLASRGTAAGSAISRSPSITGSFVTASSRRSPASKPMEFPASSKHSSRYVTEDEREEDESNDDDDDVPLAQRIPGALSAQKTIRRQFREEREQRRREKASRMENGNAERRARQETLRPAGAGVSSPNGNAAVNGSSSHDAAMLAASSVNAQKRQRTTTLPGKSLTSATFNPHDLARKLQNVQLAEVSMPAYQQQQYLLQQQQQQLALRQRSKSVSRTSADHQYPNPPHSASPSASSPAVRSRSIKDPSTQSHRQFSPTSPPVPQAHVPPVPALRPMRSFRHTSDHRSVGMDDPRSVPLPADAEQRLVRSVTSATRSHRPAAIDDPRAAADGLGRSATSATRNPHRRSPSQSRPSGDRGERLTEPVPPLPTNMHGRTSHDDPRKTSRPNTAEPRSSSSRTSGDGVPRTAAQPPLPPLSGKVMVSQQRVFVGNLQQFHMVEIGSSTTAGDVVAMMEAEGALNGWAGSGGWMVFEIAQDFGLERPVRSYELLADVQASWLKDKSVNYFVLKLSPLAIPLSRNAIPTSSPTHSGYIEWEAKRGKWSKRWLQLREHNLYLAKRDNGKDEVLICSLSNFDAYNITRAHRAPKPFAFAIKSTDNLSFFENTADYLHTFSCSEKDGKIWMEKILVARSYVLHQERHILFNPKPASNTAGAAVSRAATKKYAPVRSAQQPLVSLPPIGVAQSLPHHDVFEPGSLLAKH